MSGNLRVRKASINDIKGIDEINEKVVTNEERRSYVQDALRSGYVWIAERDKTPVGYVIATQHLFGNAFIELLIVHRDHRRQGVAQALIAAIEEWSPTEKLFTSTNESNLPMQHLCDRLGFVRSGQIDNIDEGDPELFYFKRLVRP